MKRLLKGLVLFLCLPMAYAQPSACTIPSKTRYQAVFQSLKKAPKAPIASRIQWISQQFLKSPYVLNPLGDGSADPYDQCPIYRLDGFDCETYVTSVLALTFSHNQTEYEQCLRKLRYLEGQVGFVTRKHFTNLDWNIPHQAQGLTRDITKTIKDQAGQPIYKMSHTSIDKGAWLSKLSVDRIRLQDGTSPTEKLAALKALKEKYPPVMSDIAYLPLPIEANFVLKQIPNGAIIEIVRPNWDLTQAIGTALDVSHLGFAIWKNGVLYFRNASSIHHRVFDEPLKDYLARFKDSSTVKGINVQVVAARKC